ncbi:aldo/keto reductase [Streptomyces sp. NPDC051554]|uniref:aldo/keto reductase n=1 Tax=Streptomyces sp. NPDC051554 TaxID=3365656 RepID=UPI00379ACC1F
MRTTTWRRTGLAVSRIAFGTWQLGGDWGVFAEDESKAAIRRARELGVNTSDTAQAYGFGASKRLLGSAPRDELRSNRDELAIATKGGLRRTATGVTRDAGLRALREGVDASLTALGIEDTVLPHTRQQDIGVLVYGPLAHGLQTGTFTEETTFPADDWRSKSGVFKGETYRRNLTVVRELESFAASRAMTISQLAIAWTLAHPDVHVAVDGTRHADHVEDSLAAADITLGEAYLKEIDSIMAAATPVAGPSPESS